MGKFKKCPRCDLNWIPIDEELCEVCKAEMGKASSISLLEEYDDDLDVEERICPICKINYLEPDEDICQSCRAEQAEKNADKLDDDDWQQYVDEGDEEPLDGVDDDVSLSEIEQEEEDEEEAESDEPDDFDESIIDDEEVYDDDDDDEYEEDDEDF